MQDGDSDDPAFARSACPSPFGKLDRELKTHVDDGTYSLLLHKCADLGVVPGVVLRELVYRFTRGKTLAQLNAELMAARLGEEGPIQARGGEA